MLQSRYLCAHGRYNLLSTCARAPRTLLTEGATGFLRKERRSDSEEDLRQIPYLSHLMRHEAHLLQVRRSKRLMSRDSIQLPRWFSNSVEDFRHPAYMDFQQGRYRFLPFLFGEMIPSDTTSESRAPVPQTERAFGGPQPEEPQETSLALLGGHINMAQARDTIERRIIAFGDVLIAPEHQGTEPYARNPCRAMMTSNCTRDGIFVFVKPGMNGILVADTVQHMLLHLTSTAVACLIRVTNRVC